MRRRPKHRQARNPLRLIPALTICGLAFIGGVGVRAWNTPSTAASVPVSIVTTPPEAKPAPVLRVPHVASESLTRYTVKPGESLWTIAVSHCGSGNDYTALAKANSIAGVIYPGEVITLTC
jgi:LysM repeat protein